MGHSTQAVSPVWINGDLGRSKGVFWGMLHGGVSKDYNFTGLFWCCACVTLVYYEFCWCFFFQGVRCEFFVVHVFFQQL